MRRILRPTPLPSEAGAILQGHVTHQDLQPKLSTVRPGDVIARHPFEGEAPDVALRRRAAAGAAGYAIDHLMDALSQGYIWNFETVSNTGITQNYIMVEETRPAREARLRQLISDLRQLKIALESSPLPQAWLAETVYGRDGSFSGASIADPTWTDTVMFYAHYAVSQGRTTSLVYQNSAYIHTRPTPRRVLAPRAVSRGVPIGRWIVVPDPEHQPMVYYPLSPTRSVPGTILDVWQDDRGYFYVYRSQRHYIPSLP